jgi:hypothetical protein
MGPSSDLQLDPVLHGYLKKKGVHAQLFAFPLLLSLYACVPPLSQVPHLHHSQIEMRNLKYEIESQFLRPSLIKSSLGIYP